MIKYILFIIFIYLVTIKNLYIYQLQYYDYRRLIKVKIKNINYNFLYFIPFIIVDFINNNSLLILSILFLNLILIEKDYRLPKLKYTNRIIRLISIIMLISLSVIIIFNKYIIFISVILFLLNTLLIFISNIIDYPYRLLINIKEVSKVKRKLKHINPVVIGISGSYGKTSFKNYLSILLKSKYNVLKVEGNINTFKGVVSYLNKYLDSNINILIVEIGLDKKGGMNKFLKVFNFDYGVLTGIEKCHLATFKSIENIIKEKMKIIQKSKYGLVNIDNNYLKEVESDTYSLLDLEYLKYEENQMLFKLRNDNLEYKTYIVGDQHILNIIGAMKLAKKLNIDNNLLKQEIIKLQVEKHRYEIKYIDNLLVIDDGYNSNETSFKKALDSLKYFNKYKILMTPGVIELGKENSIVNYNLGLYAINKVDEIVLIGNNSLSIKKALDDNNYLKYKYFNSFKEGLTYLKSIKDKDFITLIENDLLDYYIN